MSLFELFFTRIFTFFRKNSTFLKARKVLIPQGFIALFQRWFDLACGSSTIKILYPLGCRIFILWSRWRFDLPFAIAKSGSPSNQAERCSHIRGAGSVTSNKVAKSSCHQHYTIRYGAFCLCGRDDDSTCLQRKLNQVRKIALRRDSSLI